MNRSNEKDQSSDSRRPFSLRRVPPLLPVPSVLPPLALSRPKRARWPRDLSPSTMGVQEQLPRYPLHTLLLDGPADPQHIGVLRFCPTSSYTSPAECPKLRASMQHNSVHHRTGRSFGKGAPAPRLAPRRPRAGRRPAARAARLRFAAGRGRRRVLIFYAVAASLAGELAAIVVDVEALVLLFSLMGLFLCTVIFRAAKC